jgi:hypothetical protein
MALLKKVSLMATLFVGLVAVPSARASESSLTLRARVRASSSGDAASNALDDNWFSIWQADGASPQWLQIDLGRLYTLSKIQQVFATAGVWQFTVEASVDARHWSTLIDNSAGRAGEVFVHNVSGTFRYLKLNFLNAPQGARPSSQQFRAIVSSDGDDLARDASVRVTASSSLKNYSPEAAIDGRTSSYWVASSAAMPQWLQVDLGTICRVSEIEQSFKDFDRYAFTIQASADGQAWKTLLDNSAGVLGQTFVAPAHGNFRYVRLTCLESKSRFWAGSTALRVIGTRERANLETPVRNLSTGVSASVSSMMPAHPASHAVDLDSQTYWQAAAEDRSPWLQLDLGVPCVLSRVEQRFTNAAKHKFQIETSLDRKQWTTLIDARGGIAEASIIRPVKGLYRYVRLISNGESAGIAALNVFGVGSPRQDRWWESTSGVMRYYPKYYGTTLQQIADEVPHLKERGFAVIELMAPYAGPPDVWAGLGATDNYSIDPSIGTMADFESLIARCHAHGIRLLMFGNVGYARDTAPFFLKAQDDYRNGVLSRERDWFHFRAEPGDRWHWSPRAGAYFFGFWGDNIPSYNFRNAAWREEASHYIRFWMDKGIDGFALDAPDVYDGITPEINNAYLSDVLRTYDTWANSEGGRGADFVRDWHYNSIQDYSLTNWGGDGFSAIVPAINDGDPNGIDAILKSYRDDVNAAGGITQTAPSWEISGVSAEKRLLEIALLTTSGTLFYLHNGRHTLQPQIDVIPKWTPAQQTMLQTLMRVQNNHSALAPAGLRIKLPTQDDHKFYAYKRTDLSGGTKALVVLNFQSTPQRVQVNLTGSGIRTGQMPLDLLRSEPAPQIKGENYSLDLPAYGFAILDVD